MTAARKTEIRELVLTILAVAVLALAGSIGLILWAASIPDAPIHGTYHAEHGWHPDCGEL
jgi:hypothetical protein